MKLPSLKSLWENAKATLSRFPFVLLSSFFGAIIMIYILDLDFQTEKDNQYLWNIAMTCSLGISFLLSLTLIGERMKLKKLMIYLIQVIGIILLVLYYITIPKEVGFIDITRYFLFAIGFHLLVSFSPFVNKKISNEINGFWQFNQVLFIRILITAVYTGVLYLGLTIAILSFDKLFNVHIDSKIYGKLFFFLLGVFNTWFFLSGIPENLDELEIMTAYPKGLKIFTQYVLLPLVLIYLLILYLYTGKILIQWSLPIGWVSNLILGFSTAGIFSLLLIHPLKEQEENKWIKTISKWFYIILYPLIILLFTAILTRTKEYGITEMRYFVFVLALWLTFTALYFSFSKLKNIKVIPISLFLIAFLTSFGPWGAFSVAERSQMSRLEEILTKNNILVNGKIKKSENKITDEEAADVNSIINFLESRNTINRIQPWFDVKLDTIGKDQYTGVRMTQRNVKQPQILELMGIQYMPYWKAQTDRYINYTIKDYKLVNLSGYDYLLRFKYNSWEKDSVNKPFKPDSNEFRIFYDSSRNELNISLNGKNKINFNIKTLFEDMKKSSSQEIGEKEMSYLTECDLFKVRFIFTNINGERDKEYLRLNSINTDIFIGLKKKQ